MVVDRPLGSVHPRWPNLVYGVNSGELPGTVSGDGEPIDAYLLGWPGPVREVEGVVAALIVRADDLEDKLVVVREGASPTDGEIMKAVWFQERYFDSRVMR
ncbi:inorganic pyrophosphatase [Deinococcus aetherius]|uniref:Inorganic pyrophosphatase n=1 Tax=Deinococcus aetherius TaxID=200252 RepID=A0ABM8ADG5_9DEIO|nr:inorganic pyrophosphatase [Deinococcus aetherius]BDP41829.1 inorganic pyrophosphatase [Deinococcus aetherius]